MARPSTPGRYQVETTPSCCPRCFEDRGLKAFIGRYGTPGENCDFCGATDVRTLDIEAVAPKMEPLFDGYETSEAGKHYIRALDEEADGEPLDQLLDEDNPGLFSQDLAVDRRRALVQALLNVFDIGDISAGWGARDAGDLWVRPGSEIWAGAEDERSFLTPPERWQNFVHEISHESRYFRLDLDVDPKSYLTPALLKSLARRLADGTPLFRAVVGGAPTPRGLTHHPPERMAGPEREHSKEGLRVNAAGVPVLYAAKDIATVIAEVRPWVGAPVSVATLRLERSVRLIDFSPRRRRKPRLDATGERDLPGGLPETELEEILTTIGTAMARPIDPADSQVSYAPTQYVAEVVRQAGYDGVMFKSAVGPGVNVVLFDKTRARVDSVELFRVTGVKYSAAVAPLPPSPPEMELGGLLDDDNDVALLAENSDF